MLSKFSATELYPKPGIEGGMGKEGREGRREDTKSFIFIIKEGLNKLAQSR